MTRKILLPFVAALITLSASAQDSTKTFTVSGSVDAYYRYNFDGGTYTNNYTSFTNSQNSFELGMATLRADGSAMSGKVLATADLGFGRRAEEFSYNEGTGPNGYLTLASLKQAYVSFTPGKVGTGVKFTIGKWATHIGYEVLDAYANRNYSMDYMFSFGPFSHTGLKAEYSKGTWGFMLGVANPTDNTTTKSTTKTLIAQVSDGTKDGKLKGYLNYQGAFTPEYSVNQIDFVGTATLTSMWSLGLNSTALIYSPKNGGTSATSWGTAVYVNADPTSKVGLTLRGEYFDNTKGAFSAAHTSIFDATLSLDYKVGPFTLIPEIRLDNAKDPIFFKSTDADDAPSSKSTFTGLLAAIYKF